MKYITHIDGLRALACVLVLFFHFKMPGLEYGYLGVDVFFVISGFLITASILSEVEKGEFRFFRFSARRIIRLFPALFITILVTTIIILFLVPQSELKQHIHSAIASVFYVSNILFYSQAGYFDELSINKPFLHTWSLSVEEQFYLFWPFVILFTHKIIRNKILILSLVVGLSLAAFIFVQSFDDSAGFYIFIFRAWEFGVGGLAYLIQRQFTLPRDPKTKFLIFTLPIVMVATIICAQYFAVNFIYISIIVVIFSAMILIEKESKIFDFSLNNAVVRFLGRISYSLYLVHWPIVFFYNFYFEVDGSPFSIAILSAISLVAAFILYNLVERPSVKFKSKLSSPVVFSSYLITALLFTVFVTIIPAKKSTLELSDKDEMDILLETLATSKEKRKLAIKLTQSEAIDPEKASAHYALIGDSMANDYYVIFSKAVPNVYIEKKTFNGCRPLLDFHDPIYSPTQRKRCEKYTEELFEWLKLNQGKLDGIIIESNWSNYSMPHINRTVDFLRERDFEVYILEPRVAVKGGVVASAKRNPTLEMFRDDMIKKALWEKAKFQSDHINQIDGVTVIQTQKLQCNEAKDSCPNLLPDSNNPIIYDYNHFTVETFEYFAENMRPTLEKLFLATD